MKKVLLLLIAIFMTSSVCFSAPNYDPNMKVKIYDDSKNDALYEKLLDNFNKKYPAKVTVKKDEILYEVNYPMNAYRDEVITPYDLQKDYEYHYINK